MKKLYIGNVSYDTSEEALRQAFAKYASLVSVKLVTDKYSGQSRGFAFAEFNDDQEAAQAISEMNGFMLDGKDLRVNEARPKTEGSGGGGGGRSFGRSSGGGGGGRGSRY
jgi:cold-inducible RNA-binding protein